MDDVLRRIVAVKHEELAALSPQAAALRREAAGLRLEGWLGDRFCSQRNPHTSSLRSHAEGVRITGVTVHFVDEETDHGPILAQAAVPVLPGDTEETLHRRIQRQEHRLYPLAIQLIAEGRVHLEGRRVAIRPPRAAADDAVLLNPDDDEER